MSHDVGKASTAPSPRVSDFHYELPAELIAQTPASERTGSRLLCLDTDSGSIEDACFHDLEQLLHRNDLLVLNDTEVIPARLYGRKPTGGAVEIMVDRILDQRRVLALLGASKAPRAGQTIELATDRGTLQAVVEGRTDDLFILRFGGDTPVAELLQDYGHMPLPPYIQRADNLRDRERYQTVYARARGAVAAPTAGLHFDRPLLDKLASQGVELGMLTLHVGAGTFQPPRSDDIAHHRLHSERVTVPRELCEQIAATRQRGGRVVAVGTTTVRALESAARGHRRVQPLAGETRLFILPGYRFRVVDAMLTNFHLPGSTLLMLVCAFAGTRRTLAAYRHAVQQRYRFYSYGDAMFLFAGGSRHAV